MQIFRISKNLQSFVVAMALCALSLCARGAVATIDNDIPDLVLSAPAKSAATASAIYPLREIIRSRPLALDLPVLQKMRAAIAANQLPTMRISAFDDAALLVRLTRTERFGGNGTAYIGSVEGATFSSVVIVEQNGVVSGNINVLNRKYQIRNVGAAGHIVQQIDPTAFPPDHVAPSATASASARERAAPTSAKASPPPEAAIHTADDGSLIDVMVVYTPGARISEGDTAGMQSRINLVVAETNNAYLNSGVTQRIRLVYAGEVNYAETSLSSDLGRLQNPGDTFMDEVHALRNLYGADLVSLWGNYPSGGGCGISNIMLNEDLGFENQAFTVVDRTCATSNYSFAHELGHNMGLRHDAANDNGATTVTPEGSATLTLIGYAHGYVDAVNLFRTVMAVTNCTNCVRIPYFSNPGVNFNSAPTGVSNIAEEFRALNDTRETTANFRQSVDLTGPGATVFSPVAPVTYSVNENAVSITLSVTRHLGKTGAVSVHYATGGGTAVPDTDYTPISGTLAWGDGECDVKTITVMILQTAAISSPSFMVSLDSPTGGASLVATGFSATATVNINDVPQTGPAHITSLPPPGGFLNIPYSYKVVASGAPTIFYQLASPQTLPTGLSLNLTTGNISGTPIALGSFNGSIRASNPPVTGFFPQSFGITIVGVPPTPPTITSAVPGDTQASITFTPSISRGSALISDSLSYSVTCSPGMHTATGLTSPIDVTGLPNGISYSCAVTATTMYGTADSGTLIVTPTLNAAPALVAVKSRKLHGPAGFQFHPIGINTVITENVSVEPRSGGSEGHTLVFLFNGATTSNGIVTVKDVNAADIGTVSANRVGSTIEVTLLGVPDNKRVTVSIPNVNNSGLAFQASAGFLVGDFNNSYAVNASDISAVRAHSGQTTTSANFKFDVNASGDISSTDVSAVKARSGLVLP